MWLQLGLNYIGHIISNFSIGIPLNIDFRSKMCLTYLSNHIIVNKEYNPKSPENSAQIHYFSKIH